jgi:hypothetical protein
VATTTNLGLLYPALSAAPNVPQDLQNLASGIDALISGVILCTSATRPTARTGTVIYETDTKIVKIYDGTAWRRTPLFDSETLGTAGVIETTSLTGITSGSFITGSPACGVAFTAPPSGGVYVTVSGHLKQANNANNIMLGFEVRSGNSVGAGSVQVSGSSARALVAGNAVNASAPVELTASRRCRIQAGTLTPGAAFNVQTLHLVSGGAGTIDYRELIVEPVL